MKVVGLDPRIGGYHNNPSIGYGGCYLPKDTKQLLANFEGIPNNVIDAIVDANETRKEHITSRIIAAQPKTVGIYRLTMKTDSDNFRAYAIQGIIQRLKDEGVEVVIYEPGLQEHQFDGFTVIQDLAEFTKASDLIVSNRLDAELSDVEEQVYTRDLLSRD